MKQATTLLVCLLAACGGGGGGDGGDDGVDEFLGTWTYQAGSRSTIDCDDDGLDGTSDETGAFLVTEGSDSDLLVDQLDSDDPCPALKLDVDNGVATAVAGQTCVEMASDATITLSDQSFRATIDDAGTMTITGTGKLAISGSITAACTVSVTATAKL